MIQVSTSAHFYFRINYSSVTLHYKINLVIVNYKPLIFPLMKNNKMGVIVFDI